MRRRFQAFKQAPWRVQIRLTSGSMLPLIALLIIGGMYLAVNAHFEAQAHDALLEHDEHLQPSTFHR